MGNILKFETGLKEYTIPGPGGEYTALFNPTDLAFIERVFDAFDRMDNKQDEYKNAIDSAKGDTKDTFAVLHTMEDDMRGEINNIFSDPEAANAIFGRVTVYAIAEGLPLWVNLMLAIMDEMDSTFAREKKATNPRIKKYTAKYRGAGR